ncbi:hypothetical protein COLO4_05251 [Corchorus olitorius]|uniref:Secreted protein n=1 Tax=Corchorus olitorius TaxID=93759 RepID=A0A1R3KRK2_9ROSI|nr:hypothetical protein COLO4_05251 [Corchorus olitorius]
MATRFIIMLMAASLHTASKSQKLYLAAAPKLLERTKPNALLHPLLSLLRLALCQRAVSRSITVLKTLIQRCLIA